MNTVMVPSSVPQGMAVLVQLLTAYLALRLSRLTGLKTAWLVVSGACGIMTLRLFHHLWGLLAAGASSPLLFDATMALVISLLILLGVAGITSRFQTVADSEKNLRRTGNILTYQVMAGPAQLSTAGEHPEVA